MFGANGRRELGAALPAGELRLHEGAEVVDRAVVAPRRASAIEDDPGVVCGNIGIPHRVEDGENVGVGNAVLPHLIGDDRKLGRGEDLVHPVRQLPGN